jgi:uncharacterized membrane protein
MNTLANGSDRASRRRYRTLAVIMVVLVQILLLAITLWQGQTLIVVSLAASATFTAMWLEILHRGQQ